MHKLMAVVDPDRAGANTDTKEQPDLFPTAQMICLADVVDQSENRQKLHGNPCSRQQFVPLQIMIRRFRIDILKIETRHHIKRSE